MLNYDEIMKCPNRVVILDYVDKDTKQHISKITRTTMDPNILYYEKDKVNINVLELAETSENIMVIPIQ